MKRDYSLTSIQVSISTVNTVNHFLWFLPEVFMDTHTHTRFEEFIQTGSHLHTFCSLLVHTGLFSTYKKKRKMIHDILINYDTLKIPLTLVPNPLFKMF